MEWGTAVKAVAVALLGFALAGCAPAAHTARAPAVPVSQWQDGTDDESAVERTTSEHVAEAPTAEASAATPAPSGDTSSTMTDATSGLEPDVVHRARIEMAREALVEENQNKERVDLAEELQRELAELQANAEMSKSRVRHGRATKAQP